MINRNNIVAYISFLYQKKYNQEAPQDLLDSWAGLNDNETVIHLNGLYRHWNLDAITCKNYEQEFFNINNGIKTPLMPDAPKVSNQNNSSNKNFTQPAAKKSSNGFFIGTIIVLILGAIGYYLWDLSNKDTTAPPDVVATNEANTKVEAAAVAEAVEVAAIAKPEQNEDDNQNARVIQDLYAAERKRNFDDIYQYFDPNLERYWSINYPTRDDLVEEYDKTWSKTENNEHSNVKVNKVSDKTYDVVSTYSYFSLKDQKQKRVESKVRFVFNDEHKIIKSYGL